MSIILTGEESRGQLAAFRRESMQELKTLHRKAASGYIDHPVKGRIPMTAWDRKYCQDRIAEVEADIERLGQLLGVGASKPRRARNPDDDAAEELPEEEPEEQSACDHCGEMTNEDDLEEVGDDKWCRKCRDDDALTCEHCNKLFEGTESAEVSGETWCNDCADDDDEAFQCVRCSGRFDKNSESAEYPEDRDGPFCETCSERLDIFTCDNCGYTYTGNNYGGDSLCQECYDDNEGGDDGDGPVQGYHSHERVWNRFGQSKTGIYYGVELEAIIENTRWDFQDAARSILDKYGYLDGKEFLFTEDDCSLNSRGFETVFHPMSPEFIESHRELFEKILGDMVEHHMISYEAPDQGVSAGMHVSVMFNRLRFWERRKLLALFYDNVRLTTLVSRRPQSDLDRWARVRPPAPITQMVMKKAGYHAKTVAVNLKKVYDTRIAKNIELAEVRIFRGTLAPQGFLMNIEYVIACVGLAKDLRYGMKDTTEGHILGYIKENREAYPHIYSWLKSKGMIK